jgi:thiosulfate dehydrogenase
MMKFKLTGFYVFTALLCSSFSIHAEEFTSSDEKRWMNEFMTVVNQGEKVFHGGLKAKNTVSCDQCHPNASNIHPETYPKFQQQLGKVAVLGEMINWCIMNPTESDPLALDSPEMVAIQAYIHWERRGVKLVPGKH